MLPPPPKKPVLLMKKSSKYLSKISSITERSTLSNKASNCQQKEKYDSVDISLSSSPCSSKEIITSFNNAKTLNVDTFNSTNSKIMGM